MLLYDQAEIPLKRCNLSEAFSVLSVKSKEEELANGREDKDFDMFRSSDSSELYPLL
jgi:hypothetical protein